MTERRLDSRPFAENRHSMGYAEPAAIRDAFVRLPKRGSIEANCRWDRRLEALHLLEGAGAFAIRADPDPDFAAVRISALKGKAGACYETGRSACYTGAALAVMDDDHHLIAGSIRVCEKTGGLYTLPPYHGLLTVSNADAGKLARLETDPIPFDCNTFERDAARLAAGSFPASRAGGKSTVVFYPGPFKLLLLKNGSIVRRGICTRVPGRLNADLAEKDGVIVLPLPQARQGRLAVNYPAVYAALGAGCLIEEVVARATHAGPGGDGECAAKVPARSWAAFGKAPPDLRRRLARLVEHGEPYFVLSGSDPRDAGGCRLNALVGAANRLADAGILSVHRPPASPDACSTAVYAFAGEIEERDGQLRFSIQHDVRRRAAELLSRRPDRAPRSLR